MEDPTGLDSSKLSERLLTSSGNPDLEAQDVVMDEELRTQQTWTKGEKQPPQFRDPVFAVAFLVQIVAVIYLAFKWGVPALHYSVPDSSETIRFSGIVYISLLAGLVALAISTFALSFMVRFAATLVQMSVLFSMLSTLAVAVIVAIQGHWTGALILILLFAISACYTCLIWRRIPFAAANLVTAVTAVRSNLGITAVAYGLTVLAYVWIIVWTLSVLGVYVKMGECRNGVCQDNLNPVVSILFLLSFFWSQQVLRNVLHVTVAGVVSTWWLAPSTVASIQDSFMRSVTTSFGSICMGSLLAAILQLLRTLATRARQNISDDGILMCILECVLEILEGLIEYFNRWAYVYVGIYGYSYLEAGKKVYTLFHERGWTTIINDNLVSGVLFIMSLVVGALTGCFGLAMAAAHQSWVSEFPDVQQPTVTFLTAFLTGTALSSILMNVVASAVDTVVVCFAELPFDFQVSHPELSQQMVAAWQSVYPEEFNFY